MSSSGVAWGPVGNDPTNPSNYGFPTNISGGLGPTLSPYATAPIPINVNSGSGPGVGPGLIGSLHPDSPLFWFAAVLAITFGAVGFNAHARVGSARVGADVGKS
jgi:hypothetical protein